MKKGEWKMKKLFFSVFLTGAVLLLMSGTSFSYSPNDSGQSGSFVVGAAAQEFAINFNNPGDVAVFDVVVTGQGILSVDVKDFAPASYPDFWRATIAILGTPGAGAVKVSDVSQTNVGTPGTPGTDGYGPYAGRTDLLVSSSYHYVVLVNYDRGSGTFAAGMEVRFSYTGASITITGPRTGF